MPLAPITESAVQHCNIDVDLDEVASAVSYSAGTVRYESVEMRTADGSYHSVRQGSDGSQQIEDFDARSGATHSTGFVVRSDSRMSYDKSDSGAGEGRP